jgi:hypothetical protein
VVLYSLHVAPVFVDRVYTCIMQNVPNTAWRPTRPETQHIQLSVSITLASITVQFCYTLMWNIINWQAHSAIYWFFSWAQRKYCALVCTRKSISLFTKYCHWTIFSTIWITSAPARYVFKIFFRVIIPYMYLVSHKLTAYALIVLVPLYTIFWTIWLQSTPILPLPSRSVSISSYNLRLVFPIIPFLLLLHMTF